ncbi:MAG TPA: A/G-specific adenine glycosylase [Xanthobacteraceae bacterium]|nr:A/G-specific adenine glycosylase [Xanthobacteraceae bacterium]
MTLAGDQALRKARGTAGEKSPAAARSLPAAAELLDWYDRNRRDLPWRARAGAAADPYRVWLSEIMLQQTTVTAVAPYFARFLTRWPSLAALAAAPLEDVLKSWAGLGYYARARNLHACARLVMKKYDGAFPCTEAGLRELPGIGPYTAGAIAAIAFGAQAAAVDGNAERVIARLFAVEQALPAAKSQIRDLAASLVPPHRSGDFAQAMMDLGATICTPARPACTICPWMPVCRARERGDPGSFPRRMRKSEGRLRRGAAFVLIKAGGKLLVRTRPPKGLLGGMTEVPTTEWVHDFDDAQALRQAPRLKGTRPKWQRLPGSVRHVFTHFPLELVVYSAEVAADAIAPAGTRWIALEGLSGEALPSLMRKVVAHAVKPR